MNKMEPIKKARTYWNMDNVITFDIETKNWTDAVVVIGLYDGNKFDKLVEDNSNDLIDRFIDLMFRTEYRNCRFVAHNGGKFDFIPIISRLYDRDYFDNHKHAKIDILNDGQNSVFYIQFTDKFGKPRYLQDTLKLMPRSYENLAESFAPEYEKGDYDYENIDYKHEMKPEDWDELIDYLKIDTVGLYKILEKFTEILFDISNGKVGPQLTIGSTAMALFRANFQSDTIFTGDGSDKEEKVRNAYYGGRTEVFKHTGRDLKYYDVNSLYPYVYTYSDVPIGRPTLVDNPSDFLDDLNYGGVIYIEGKQFGDYPVLPTRYTPKDAQTPRVVFPRGHIEGYYTLPEIRYALENNLLEIDTIGEGIIAKNGKPFKDYGENLFNRKNNTNKIDQSGKYDILKFLLNAFYGKFGMEREQTKIVRDKDLKDDYLDIENDKVTHIDPDLALMHNIYQIEEESQAKYIAPRIACTITGNARIELHKWIMRAKEKGGDVYYCDTDSIVTDVELPEGNKLGEMDLEHEFKEGFFIQPKVYAGMTKEGERLVKGKGMKVSERHYNKMKEAYLTKNPSKIWSRYTVVESFKASLNKTGIPDFNHRESNKTTKSFDIKRKHDIDKNTSDPLELTPKHFRE